ncbi:uncharacterized protein TNCT_517302 [Trichonephila clavata]|uniref:Uncharacterized protein n=1 Tax=Trichonephila clavata TaxID=2740835 RepID=A0A8X6L515_TRICU|nr:uncharacterized protein TNCT_517302 [Trichonephila clavata]
MDLDGKMNYNENCLATFNDLHDDANCSLDFFSTLDKYLLREDTLTTSAPSLSKTDNREDIGNLVENAFISTSDNSLKSTYSGSEHGSWFDGLSKENEDLKRANTTLKQKITHQNRLIANCEEKLAISMKDLFSTKEELDQLKKKNEENETENSNLKLHIEQLKVSRWKSRYRHLIGIALPPI